MTLAQDPRTTTPEGFEEHDPELCAHCIALEEEDPWSDPNTQEDYALLGRMVDDERRGL